MSIVMHLFLTARNKPRKPVPSKRGCHLSPRLSPYPKRQARPWRLLKIDRWHSSLPPSIVTAGQSDWFGDKLVRPAFHCLGRRESRGVAPLLGSTSWAESTATDHRHCLLHPILTLYPINFHYPAFTILDTFACCFSLRLYHQLNLLYTIATLYCAASNPSLRTLAFFQPLIELFTGVVSGGLLTATSPSDTT